MMNRISTTNTGVSKTSHNKIQHMALRYASNISFTSLRWRLFPLYHERFFETIKWLNIQRRYGVHRIPEAEDIEDLEIAEKYMKNELA